MTDLDHIVVAYANTLLATGNHSSALAAAWGTVRSLPSYRHLRAPYAVEQLAANTGRRRSYRSPLGSVLADLAPEECSSLGRVWGHHCAAWPRTVRSYDEQAHMRDSLIHALDRLAARRAP